MKLVFLPPREQLFCRATFSGALRIVLMALLFVCNGFTNEFDHETAHGETAHGKTTQNLVILAKIDSDSAGPAIIADDDCAFGGDCSRTTTIVLAEAFALVPAVPSVQRKRFPSIDVGNGRTVVPNTRPPRAIRAL